MKSIVLYCHFGWYWTSIGRPIIAESVQQSLDYFVQLPLSLDYEHRFHLKKWASAGIVVPLPLWHILTNGDQS